MQSFRRLVVLLLSWLVAAQPVLPADPKKPPTDPLLELNRAIYGPNFLGGPQANPPVPPLATPTSPIVAPPGNGSTPPGMPFGMNVPTPQRHCIQNHCW
ncbi:hypothetical protein [Gloeobacter kilaueensis]|uniref:Uncharacterized protein n=1 Tax=Gloeobacter kilaueensis (strain ATCC BAA-2537 / CCAP 1431/1 / ULC 316 / JS1) TaxID=1183438 RepID=U5QNP1_GLOK1|nr:hypothetical protein [Gloeobacter kilaueensis]AGY59214.1 hypothetical protein GKIL_2968 [Gloeobacter kilaueensis JS1]